MNNTITIEPAELAPLLSLIGEYGTSGDIITAAHIYRESGKRTNDGDWAHLIGLANVLRVGYILGQRTERRRHTRLSAFERLFCLSERRAAA